MAKGADPIVLDYSLGGGGTMRRCCLMWAFRGVVVVAVGLLLQAADSAVRERVALVSAERAAVRACLAFGRPPTEVVFDESVRRRGVMFFPRPGAGGGPVRVASRGGSGASNDLDGGDWNLLRMPAEWSTLWDARRLRRGGIRCESGLRPGFWAHVHESTGQTQDPRCSALLFMHERRTPGGGRRLVVVTFDAPAFVCGRARPFGVTTYGVNFDGTLGRAVDSRIDCSGFAPASDQAVKVYAGRPHRTDPARFAMGVRIGARAREIEGRLHDDGGVSLALE